MRLGGGGISTSQSVYLAVSYRLGQQTSKNNEKSCNILQIVAKKPIVTLIKTNASNAINRAVTKRIFEKMLRSSSLSILLRWGLPENDLRCVHMPVRADGSSVN